MRGSDVVYTDQSGIGVDGTNHWIWDFVTNSGTLIVIRSTKARRCWKRYGERLEWHNRLRWLEVSSQLRQRSPWSEHQRCWAHMLTEADELAEKTKKLSLGQGSCVKFTIGSRRPLEKNSSR